MSSSPRKSRTQVKIPVEYEGLSEEACIKGKGTTLDLNLNGCRVAGHTAVPRGAYLRMQLRIPGAAKPVKIDMARVRWVQGSSFGVEFIQRSADDIPLLSKIAAETVEHGGGVAQSLRRRLESGSCTVLIVEDDPDVLQFCARTLEDVGCRVLKASGSVEALQINTAHLAPIHVMLVDLLLRPSVFQLSDGKERHPRVHGHTFVELAVKVRKNCHVVYMSGHDEHALTALGIRIGGRLCLQKPFSREDLLVAIDQTLASPPAVYQDSSGDVPRKKVANNR